MVESLPGGIAFDVQGLEAKERELAELALGLPSEGGRDVGEDVLGAILGQHGQQVRGQSTCSGADLDRSQATPLGQGRDDRLERVASQHVVEARDGEVSVHVVELGRLAARKEELKRI